GRQRPVWAEPNAFGHNSELGVDNYNARYYSKTETEGWPDLLRFIFRTVLIYLDQQEGVSQETRKAVMKSIPKQAGDPLETARKFAIFTTWKRGNETVPEWVYPDAQLPTRADQKIKPPQAEARKSERRPPATSSRSGPRKIVCDSCREKKIACKHVDSGSAS